MVISVSCFYIKCFLDGNVSQKCDTGDYMNIHSY